MARINSQGALIVSIKDKCHHASNTRRLSDDELAEVSGGRSIPNGKTDVIKVMGNAK